MIYLSDRSERGECKSGHHCLLCDARSQTKRYLAHKEINKTGGSPGLMVMAGYSSSQGRDFESLPRILDGSFSYLFVVPIDA